MPMRDLPFVHRFYQPEAPDGSVMILLHGTGGDETDLMPLAARIAPQAVLLGVRGRAIEDGSRRWFRRAGETGFDQQDIRAEAQAFAAFVAGAVQGYGLTRGRLTALGYSNGANFLGAALRLHPGPVRRMILLRPAEVLDPPPAADLSGTRVLMVPGARDPLADMVPALAAAFRVGGADVDVDVRAAGHELAPDESGPVSAWLAAG